MRENKHTHKITAKIENKRHFCGNETENHWCVKQGEKKPTYWEEISFTKQTTNERIREKACKPPRVCVCAFSRVSLTQINLILTREKQTSRLFSLIYIKCCFVCHTSQPLKLSDALWYAQAITRFLMHSTSSANAEIRCGNNDTIFPVFVCVCEFLACCWYTASNYKVIWKFCILNVRLIMIPQANSSMTLKCSFTFYFRNIIVGVDVITSTIDCEEREWHK